MPLHAMARVRLEAITADENSFTRTIDLVPGVPLTLGRASSSDTTQHAKEDNALFACPVISRKHAQLTATPAEGSPGKFTVTIEELGSTHGTFVNGHTLLPGEPRALQDGDLVKLGDRVVNANAKHDGVYFEFLSLNHPDSEDLVRNRGYHPPESDSDDDAEHAQPLLMSPKVSPQEPRIQPTSQGEKEKGSQAYPINLDEDHDTAPRPERSFASGPIDCVKDTYDIGSVQSEDDYNEERDPLTAYEGFSDMDDLYGVADESSGDDDEDAISVSDASDLRSDSVVPVDGIDESATKNDEETAAPQSTTKTMSPELGHDKPQSSTHYDPVRGSQPPAGPHRSAPVLPVDPESTLPPRPTVSQERKSRWDMQPQATNTQTFHTPTFAELFDPAMRPVPSTQTLTDHGNSQSMVMPPYGTADISNDPQVPPMPTFMYGYPIDRAPFLTQNADTSSYVIEDLSPDFSTGQPSSKDRISISDIVDSNPPVSQPKKRKIADTQTSLPFATFRDMSPTTAAAVQDINATLPAADSTAVDQASLEKAIEVLLDEPMERPAKKPKPAAATTHARAHERKIIKRLKRATVNMSYYGGIAARASAVVAKYSTAAAVGAVGMFAFLCSDQAEQLVTRLG